MNELAHDRSGPTIHDLKLANLGLDADMIERLAAERLPQLDRLEWRSVQHIVNRKGVTIFAAGAVLTPALVGQLLMHRQRDNIRDIEDFNDQIHIAQTVNAVREFERDLLGGRPYDLGAMRAAVTALSDNLGEDRDVLATVLSLGERCSGADAIVSGHYTSVVGTALVCALIGRRFGYLPEIVHDLTLAGLTADIGMVFVDSAVLRKGKLSEQDFATIKRHPTISFRVLAKTMAVSADVLAAVHGHQKHIDGTGYPDAVHVPGDYARIVTVASAFVAMTRKGKSPDEAVSALALSAQSVSAAGAPLTPKYDARFVNALDSLLGKAPVADAVPPGQNAVTSQLAAADYETTFFAGFSSLVDFLEHLAVLEGKLRELETESLTTTSVQEAPSEALRNFVSRLSELGQFPRAMGVSPEMNVEEFFSDGSEIRQLEKESYVVLTEMIRLLDITRRQTEGFVEETKDQAIANLFDRYLELADRVYRLIDFLVPDIRRLLYSKHPPPSGIVVAADTAP